MKKYKIACMGDSLTEGYNIDLTYRWTDLLQKDLGIEIINCGISGDTTAGMLSRFQKMLLEHQPTHVIIMGGTNDLWHKLPDQFIISNIMAMIRQARHQNIIPIIGIPPPSYEADTTNASILFREGTKLALHIDMFREKLKQLAIEDNFPIIDFGSKMPDFYFLNDGIHPNESGQEFMKEKAKAALQTIIPEIFET